MAKRKSGVAKELKTLTQYLVTSGIEYRGQRLEAEAVVTLDDLKGWPQIAVQRWIETGVLKKAGEVE